MHFQHSGEQGCRSLSHCAPGHHWHECHLHEGAWELFPVQRIPSDRRSDFRSRTEELTQTLVEGCHLPDASLNTCEYRKPLGILVKVKKRKEKKNTCTVSRIYKFSKHSRKSAINKTLIHEWVCNTNYTCRRANGFWQIHFVANEMRSERKGMFWCPSVNATFESSSRMLQIIFNPVYRM